MSSNRLVLVVLLSAALGSAACSGNESSPLEPTARTPAYSEWTGGSSEPAGSYSEWAESSQEDQQGQHGWGDSKPASCKPLSARSESKDIGPQGGVLHIGPHLLTVLPGALLQTTRITGQITADTVNSVQFSPAGLQFLLPAVLQLSYENCKSLDARKMKVVYTTNNLLSLLELIPSEDRRLKKTVVGLVRHFSRYAIAY